MREQSRALASTLGPLAIYALLSLGFFGRALLLHGDRDYLGTGYDPQIFIWSLGWWVLFNQIPEGGGPRVVRLARGIEATVILLDAEHAWWGPELVEAGLEPVGVGGVRLYHLRPARPSCG